MLDPVLAIVPVGIGLVAMLLWARRQGKKAANLPLSHMGKEKWRAWRDSNSRPTGSKPVTLSS